MRKGWVTRFAGDLFYLANAERKWWLMPLFLLLLILSLLMVFAALTGPLAPFIYPIL